MANNLLNIFKSKKNEYYNLLKFYIALEEDSWVSRVNMLLREYELLLDEEKKCFYSLNYRASKPLKIDSLSENLRSIELHDFEYLMLLNDSESVRMVFSTYRSYRDDLNMYEVDVIFPVSQDINEKFSELSRKLVQAGSALYGYGRVLSTDYDSSTENKIKKSLFGNTSVKVGLVEKEWLHIPSEKEHMLKGIYGLNLLPKNLLKLDIFSHQLTNRIGSIDYLESDFVIMKFSSEELQGIKSEFQDVSQFIRS